MLEIMTVAVFVWLMFKVIGLMLRLTWGVAKLVAGIMMFLAMPVLVVCLLFVGGIFLLVPIGLVAAALLIVKACV